MLKGKSCRGEAKKVLTGGRVTQAGSSKSATKYRPLGKLSNRNSVSRRSWKGKGGKKGGFPYGLGGLPKLETS